MPVYDYTCTTCRRTTEVVHAISAPGPRFCPECGAEGTMRKAFAAPAVHFKGSGWAKKDRTATSSRNRAAPAAEGSGEAETRPSGDDSKPSGDGSKPSDRGETKPSGDGSKPSGEGAASSSGDSALKAADDASSRRAARTSGEKAQSSNHGST